MKEQSYLRHGFAVGVATLTGLSAAALGVVGICEHADRAAQRDVTLVSAADDAHGTLVAAQAGLDPSQFLNDVALQQNIYSWALEPMANGGLGLPDDSLLFPGNADDPADSLFNGAFSRFAEANLVGQALIQVQLDQLLGVNQTLDVGAYEALLGEQLFDDLAGDLDNLIDPDTLPSASGFQDALLTLPGDLVQTAWIDLFGMFGVADLAP